MEDLKVIFHELAEAIKSGDVDSGVSALKAFFHTVELEPHEEEGYADGGEIDMQDDKFGVKPFGVYPDHSAQEEEAEEFGELY